VVSTDNTAGTGAGTGVPAEGRAWRRLTRHARRFRVGYFPYRGWWTSVTGCPY